MKKILEKGSKIYYIAYNEYNKCYIGEAIIINTLQITTNGYPISYKARIQNKTQTQSFDFHIEEDKIYETLEEAESTLEELILQEL